VVAADRVIWSNTGVLEDQEVAVARLGQVLLAQRGRDMPGVMEEVTVQAEVVVQEPSDQTELPLLVVMAVLECRIV
jgi:hypothetical protein